MSCFLILTVSGGFIHAAHPELNPFSVAYYTRMSPGRSTHLNTSGGASLNRDHCSVM